MELLRVQRQRLRGWVQACRVEAGTFAWRVPATGRDGAPRAFKLHASSGASLSLSGGRQCM